MKNIFDPGVTEEQLRRIRALSADRRPLWGKMDAGQMLAHLCVVYELTYETRHRRPGPLLRWLLRTFVKRHVVGEKPYPRNSPTAPAFRISTPRDFEHERERLIAYLRRTQALGREAFEGRDYPSFGPMTAEEWNTLFFKHLDHHLTQFGV